MLKQAGGAFFVVWIQCGTSLQSKRRTGDTRRNLVRELSKRFLNRRNPFANLNDGTGDASCYASSRSQDRLRESCNRAFLPLLSIQSASETACRFDQLRWHGSATVYSKQASSHDTITAARPASAYLFSCFKASRS